MNQIIKRQKVNLSILRINRSQLLAKGNSIVSKMLNSSYFNGATARINNAKAALDELKTAHVDVMGGGRKKFATAREKRRVVETLLTGLGFIVEEIANRPANIGISANVIIRAAGMSPKKFTPRQKQTFAVKRGNTSGSVVLTGSTVKHASHQWQYSSTPGKAKTWVDVPASLQSKITIKGLTRATKYYFRHRMIQRRNRITRWEGPVSIIVA